MNINNLDIGQKVKVLKIEGRGAEKRLFEIGIMEGAELQLITRHPFKGPLVIKVGNANVALGRSIADKVKVEAV
ncbi:MAG: ferrous iron transport protein A [Firmicutes bacterium HGW-Firmicutes-15]|nr:MAG: ferrous iron transport protein A [Firmicutes bacterium HGW-Firmicutes-15]